MFCKNCGKQLSNSAPICPNCGHPTYSFASSSAQYNFDNNVSDKEWIPTLLLCFFLGYLGIHSFYVGKPWIGILQILTCGGCGIWVLVDFILIVTKTYRDGNGRVVCI